MACKQAAMSWIFNGAGSFEKLPVQEDGPRTCHSERSEESQNECAEAKHIKIQDFSCLTTFHCNSIFALLLSFPKSLNFLLSPLEFAGEPWAAALISRFVKTKKELNWVPFCDPDRIQTCNLLIRSQMLYSVELRDRLLSFDVCKGTAFFETCKTFDDFFSKKWQ